MSDSDYSPSPQMPRNAALIGIGGAAFVGLLFGVLGHAILSPQKIEKSPPEVIKQELTEDELLALCDETTEDVRESLGAAHEKVIQLESDLATKEAELEKMKAEDEKDEARKAAAAVKWKAMEEEIATLKVQLAQAQEERDAALTELKETVVKLEYEIQQKEKAVRLAKKYKKESTENLWKAFGADAKVQICDRGTEKRHENCYEAVDSAIAGYKDRFNTCVDAQGAVPVLKQGSPKDTLPAHAEWVNPDSKFMTEGLFSKQSWFVIFCDPTLPEARLDEDIDDIPI